MFEIGVWIEKAVSVVWYYPVVGLCLFTGLFFTLYKTFFVQVKGLHHAMTLISGHYDNPNEHGQITHFQALSTALSGTIGLGNIAGVSIAIELGGPGAVFWMWVVGFFGMATKFAECTLGTYYRDEDPVTGEVRGGPMYYIQKGMGEKWRPLAVIFATCVLFGSFGGGGMFQSNQAAEALHKYYSIDPNITGIALALLVGVVILGGIQRIGKVASKIVPVMCIIYVLGALFICGMNYDRIPFIFRLIVDDAFTGSAMMGGGMGSVLLWGVRRAVFSNEAGLGTASIAHAAVKTDYPVREGIVASLGPLIDTLIVCSATAAIIIMAGSYGTGVYQTIDSIPDQAISLTGDWKRQIDAPEDNDPLKVFRVGEQVFEASNPNSRTRLRIPLVPNASDAVRFSYYNELGSMMVKVYDQLDNLVYELPIGVIDPDTVPDEPLYSIGCSRHKAWEGCVMTGHLLKDFKGYMLLEPSPDSHWYIDKIETVEKLQGISLTIASFNQFFKGFGTVFISISVFLFAFSTMLSWSYYGETAVMYIFASAHHDKSSITPLSHKASTIFKAVFIIFIYIGAVRSLEVVVNFTDLMVGLMVIPNSIGILALSTKVSHLAKDYFQKLKAGAFPIYK